MLRACDHHIGNDDYTQPGNLFRLIQRHQIAHFAKADRACGVGLAQRLGLDMAAATAAEQGA
jgi:catalase